ncbi:MAG TPA: hypothetical protein PLF41_10580, partial [Anaerolineales bacterium]|nr:hypothetical protein [Anaerolineales bacterium]
LFSSSFLQQEFGLPLHEEQFVGQLCKFTGLTNALYRLPHKKSTLYFGMQKSESVMDRPGHIQMVIAKS